MGRAFLWAPLFAFLFWAGTAEGTEDLTSWKIISKTDTGSVAMASPTSLHMSAFGQEYFDGYARKSSDADLLVVKFKASVLEGEGCQVGIRGIVGRTPRNTIVFAHFFMTIESGKRRVIYSLREGTMDGEEEEFKEKRTYTRSLLGESRTHEWDLNEDIDLYWYRLDSELWLLSSKEDRGIVIVRPLATQGGVSVLDMEPGWGTTEIYCYKPAGAENRLSAVAELLILE